MNVPTNNLEKFLLENEDTILADFQQFVTAHEDEKWMAIGNIANDACNMAQVPSLNVILWIAKHHPGWLRKYVELIPEKSFSNTTRIIANILVKVQ